MRRLIAFESVSLDGYFTGVNGDLSWAHTDTKDPEWDAFVNGNASGGGVLVFGRVTYEMMVSYWPTPAAAKNDPVVAEGMNKQPKIVFAKTLKNVSWNNTKLVKGDPAAEIRRMKSEPGENMAVLGSATIVSQLAKEGLVDEYQIVVIPVVLGEGRTLFEGVKEKLRLRLTKTRSFGNGNVVLTYEPRA